MAGATLQESHPEEEEIAVRDENQQIRADASASLWLSADHGRAATAWLVVNHKHRWRGSCVKTTCRLFSRGPSRAGEPIVRPVSVKFINRLSALRMQNLDLDRFSVQI